jgi:thiamine-monophosphate kinase
MNHLFVSVCYVFKEKLVYRNGVKVHVGDLICITGDVGAAYLGLQILEREKQIHTFACETLI